MINTEEHKSDQDEFEMLDHPVINFDPNDEFLSQCSESIIISLNSFGSIGK